MISCGLVTACALLAVAAASRAAAPMYEEAPINYRTATPRDSVAHLIDAIEKGDRDLTPSAEHGYLDALLKSVDIASSSQTLVFSKTSFQAGRISPTRPRALYFNDDTYIGYVPGGDVIEVASVDPALGTIFYTIKQPAGPGDAKPAIVRETDKCLQCHGESLTRDVPGLVVRSVFSDDAGIPLFQAGTFRTTHESPLSERWGGWYVSGDSSGQPHMGNTRWSMSGQEPRPIAPPAQHVKDLSDAIDTSLYLTPHSDIVALMVLEHQVEAHNLATRAAHGTLRALRDEKVMADALGETLEPGKHSDSALSRVKGNCEPLVEYLLFAGEAPLNGKVTGSSSFSVEFSSRGPRDARGRSLRDLDLSSRLFRYPCSYLIYSRSVMELPEVAKNYIYRRLHEVLSGKDTSKPFSHLSPADRTAIAEILRETHAEIRAAWEALGRG